MTYNIGEMENLKERLGKYHVERIQYQHDNTPVNRGKNVVNTVMDQMQCRKPKDTFCPVNDIIAGVCRLDHYNQKHRNIPLSQVRVYNILQCMEIINTREVKKMLDVNDRQARVYVKACELAVQLLQKHFEECEDFLDGDDIGVDFDEWNC